MRTLCLRTRVTATTTTSATGALATAQKHGRQLEGAHRRQVNHGTAEKIEAWIRAHPSFGSNAAQNAPVPQVAASVDIADQLVKLAQLCDSGVLSPQEFDQAKAKLLG